MSIQHFFLKQVFPGINVSSTQARKNTLPTDQTSPSLTSSVGNSSEPTSASCRSQQAKKKQTVHNFKLFPKKRKFVEEVDDEEISKRGIVSKNV